MIRALLLATAVSALWATSAFAQTPYNNYQVIQLPNGCLAIVHNWGYWSGGGMPAPTYSYPQYPAPYPYPYNYGYGMQQAYPRSFWHRRWG